MGNVDIFTNYHTRGNVVAEHKFIDAGAENGAEDRIHASETPAFGQLLVDERIDLDLLAHHARDQVAEEGGLGVSILAILDLLAETMRLEFGDYVGQVDAGHVHLVERLHGGKPGGAARSGAVFG